MDQEMKEHTCQEEALLSQPQVAGENFGPLDRELDGSLGRRDCVRLLTSRVLRGS